MGNGIVVMCSNPNLFPPEIWPPFTLVPREFLLITLPIAAATATATECIVLTPVGFSLLTREDLSAVLGHLEVLGDNWEAIQSVGLELRVPGRKLNHIQQRHPVESMERVVLHWLDSANRDKCTWAYLVSSLRNLHKKSPGGRIGRRFQSMASRIGKKYFLPRSSWTGMYVCEMCVN